MVSGIGHFVSWATEVVILNAVGIVLNAPGEGTQVTLTQCVFVLSVPSMFYAIFPTVQGGAQFNCHANVAWRSVPLKWQLLLTGAQFNVLFWSTGSSPEIQY